MFKCDLCGERFINKEGLIDHIDSDHSDDIPKNFSAAQYYYLLKTGKDRGSCIMCKMDTRWNEATGKYHRFCDMVECKEKYKKEFRQRMIGKYGRVHLLNDPEQQKKMLANRSISGKYKWSDGVEIPYTGSYEEDFLRFLDVFMNFESSDIISPSPHVYYYIYEGQEKFYIPDFFIPSLNLEIEIKDGGDNPNNHHKIQEIDKVKERLKDDVMTSQSSFHYVKLTNKIYDPFFMFLTELKKRFNEQGENMKPIFILADEILQDGKQIVHENYNVANKYVFFGLTKEEIKKGYIDYPKTNAYLLKGINLSYDGLVRFINDNKLVNDVPYYTILPMSKFHIDTNVEHDTEYNMVAAKLPIKIKIDKFYPLSMEPKGNSSF